ncbi:MAG TPA: helicase-related protein, partial [Devosiaceae bacterium]|nr:helicase-related protein [Devosiaceae bacterium]
ALVTGEERVVPSRARYWVATVEAMPVGLQVECLAVDEIQTATHFDRGHVFTDRLLNARGSGETLLLGAGTMEPVIRKLLPGAEIVSRPRLSELTYTGSRKITRQPRRTAIVAFSAAEVYAVAELIRRQRGGAAVVMGALSPRTRNAQVELFESGDVDFLVATDAIGMGLNLNIDHVSFAADRKFDGHQWRHLTPAEFGQIAGRAGRHTRNGSFGVTAGTAEFEPEVIERLESHDFEPVRNLQWRNPHLDFSSLEALNASLEVTPAQPVLTRVPVVTDQLALNNLMRREVAALAAGEAAVRLAWECCQIPDYREISPALHADTVATIFSDLMRTGALSDDWIAEQVRFCDNIAGEIDTLSNRIRQIRTWTFVANRKDWLKDPAHWRETTRDIEDRLSDALHEKLTQRFVDRRTSLLMRHLRDGAVSEPEINAKGEVLLEGHVIGAIEGFRFSLARTDGETDSRSLRTAAGAAISPEISRRADRLGDAPNDEFVLTTDGYVRWRGDVVAELAEGNELLTPRLIILADESLTGPELEKVQDRLNLWLRHTINTQLEALAPLREPAELDGTARGVAFRLAEELGVLPRPAIADEVKSLDQDVRARMRKLGIKFGAYHIYLPGLLKPSPRELALVLWALKNGGVRQPGVSDLPQTVLSGRTSIEVDPTFDSRLYEVAGFKLAGKRAVRVDILERLADIIRPLIAFDPERADVDVPDGAAPGSGFRVTVAMTSLLGCAGEEFASVLTALGYRVTRTPIEPIEPAAPAGDAPPEAAAPVAEHRNDAPAEAGAPVAELPNDVPAQTVKAEAPAVAEVPAPAPDGASEATATADAGEATAPDGASEAAAEPAEPQFDEVWSPAPRRPRHDARPAARPAGQPDKPGKRRARRPRRKDAGGSAEAGEGVRPDAKARNDVKRNKPAEPRFDPDSPFAALAALRDGVPTRK